MYRIDVVVVLAFLGVVVVVVPCDVFGDVADFLIMCLCLLILNNGINLIQQKNRENTSIAMTN